MDARGKNCFCTLDPIYTQRDFALEFLLPAAPGIHQRSTVSLEKAYKLIKRRDTPSQTSCGGFFCAKFLLRLRILVL